MYKTQPKSRAILKTKLTIIREFAKYCRNHSIAFSTRYGLVVDGQILNVLDDGYIAAYLRLDNDRIITYMALYESPKKYLEKLAIKRASLKVYTFSKPIKTCRRYVPKKKLIS